MSKAYEDAMEERWLERTAAAFGITNDQLSDLSYEIDGNCVSFNLKESDPDIIAKISGVGPDGLLWVSPNALEDDEDSRQD